MPVNDHATLFQYNYKLYVSGYAGFDHVLSACYQTKSGVYKFALLAS